MASEHLQIIWSVRAMSDLKIIYDWILEKSLSKETAIRIRTKIIDRSNEINFPEQYQRDEVLGFPYRRMFVGNYKIVYRPEKENIILIIRIFDTRQNPQKIQETKSE